jgi:hypothetical protein
MSREWLEAVKVGDRVFVSNRWDGIRPSVVTRLTKTQLVCGDDERFRRSDGTSVGGGQWHRTYLYEANEANKTAYAHQVALAALGRMNWSFLDQADAIEIARQVREMVAQKKAKATT